MAGKRSSIQTKSRGTLVSHAGASRRAVPNCVFSRREVAELAGVSLHAIDKAIEQRVLPRHHRRNETLIGEDGLVVMAILARANIELPVKVKQRVRRWVSIDQPYAKKGEQELKVSDVITICFSDPVRELVAEAEQYAKQRETYIESNPEIFGGQPVIAGTRIPVHMIEKRLELGDSIETLVEDYPHVDPEAFEVAARYAKTHPQRGRPVKPWREGKSRQSSQA